MGTIDGNHQTTKTSAATLLIDRILAHKYILLYEKSETTHNVQTLTQKVRTNNALRAIESYTIVKDVPRKHFLY